MPRTIKKDTNKRINDYRTTVADAQRRNFPKTVNAVKNAFESGVGGALADAYKRHIGVETPPDNGYSSIRAERVSKTKPTSVPSSATKYARDPNKPKPKAVTGSVPTSLKRVSRTTNVYKGK